MDSMSDIIKTVLNATRARFDTVWARFDTVWARFDTVWARFDAAFKELDKKLDRDKIPQADMSVNDSSDPSYVKNRPCYDDENGKTAQLPNRFIPIATNTLVGGVKGTNANSSLTYGSATIGTDGTVKFPVWYAGKRYSQYNNHTASEWAEIYGLYTNGHIFDIDVALQPLGYASYSYVWCRIVSIARSSTGLGTSKPYHYRGCAVADNTGVLYMFSFRADTDKTYVQRMSVPEYGSFSLLFDKGDTDGKYLRVNSEVLEWTDEIAVPSSVESSEKRFRITTDDSGVPTFAEEGNEQNFWTPSGGATLLWENPTPTAEIDEASGLTVEIDFTKHKLYQFFFRYSTTDTTLYSGWMQAGDDHATATFNEVSIDENDGAPTFIFGKTVATVEDAAVTFWGAEYTASRFYGNSFSTTNEFKSDRMIPVAIVGFAY